MRTTYISQDSDAVRKPGYNEKTAKAMREVSDKGRENKLHLSSDPKFRCTELLRTRHGSGA